MRALCVNGGVTDTLWAGIPALSTRGQEWCAFFEKKQEIVLALSEIILIFAASITTTKMHKDTEQIHNILKTNTLPHHTDGGKEPEISYSDYSRWDRFLGMTAPMTQVPLSPRLLFVFFKSVLGGPTMVLFHESHHLIILGLPSFVLCHSLSVCLQR